MDIKYSLEDLKEKLESLSLQCATSLINDADRQIIADKFENKSLQELNEIAHQLKLTRSL